MLNNHEGLISACKLGFSKSKMRKWYLLLITILFGQIIHAQIIVYVDSSNTAFNQNGKTPSTAYSKLQDALSYARITPSRSGFEIRVAKGTYFPDEGNGYTNNDQNAAFELVSNTSIKGGYPAGFPLNKGRNYRSNPTILSGDIQQNGTSNSYIIIQNVFSSHAPLVDASVDGFTIEKNSDFGLSNRSGIYNTHSNLVVKNCIIKDNHANSTGAGAWNEDSNVNFINCLFFNNFAPYGKAMRNIDSQVEIINCTFATQSRVNLGQSFLQSNGGDVDIKNSIFWGANTPLENFGNNPHPYTVQNSLIEGSFAGSNVFSTDPRFLNPSSLNFQLNVCSPAINSGDNTFLAETNDLNFSDRVRHDQIDMGAFEYNMEVMYVNKSASGNNDGTSWTHAFNHLQDALHELEVCGSPAEVWITNDTYFPDEGTFVSNGDRTETFKLFDKVYLYGGFAGIETSINGRNPSQFTTLSGDLANNDLFNDFTENSYHVLTGNFPPGDSTLNTCFLNGFIITGGNANVSGNSSGSGIEFSNATLELRNVLFNQNRGTSGSGLNAINANLLLVDCVFFDNIAETVGGALRINNSYARFYTTEFSNNLSELETIQIQTGAGGAGIIGTSNCLFDNCTFTNNQAYREAGGLRISAASHVELKDSRFFNNSGRKGGAINIAFSTLNIENCTFEQNSVEGLYGLNPAFTIQHGGGIHSNNSTISIKNSLFDGNRTENNGGAIYVYQSNLSIESSKFEKNEASFINQSAQGVPSYGAAIYIDQLCKTDIISTQFSENKAFDGGGAIYVNSDSTSIENCLFYDNQDFTNTVGAIYLNDGITKILSSTFGLKSINNANASIIASTNNPGFEVHNSILWANATQEIQNNGSGGVVSNTILSSTYLGGGIHLYYDNPEFVKPDTGNFALKRCSPALNIGDLIYTNESTDLLGNSRVLQTGLDLGAFESNYIFQTNCDCPLDSTFHGILTSGTYKASNSIDLENGTIESGTEVNLGANGYIEIKQPLLIEAGAVVTIQPLGCVPD